METLSLIVGGVHVIDVCDNVETAYENARDYADRHRCNVSIVRESPRYIIDTIDPA